MNASINDDWFTRRALGACKHSSGALANALLAMSGADSDAKGRPEGPPWRPTDACGPCRRAPHRVRGDRGTAETSLCRRADTH